MIYLPQNQNSGSTGNAMALFNYVKPMLQGSGKQFSTPEDYQAALAAEAARKAAAASVPGAATAANSATPSTAPVAAQVPAGQQVGPYAPDAKKPGNTAAAMSTGQTIGKIASLCA